MTRLVSVASKQDKAYAQNIHDYLIINHFNDYTQNYEMRMTLIVENNKSSGSSNLFSICAWFLKVPLSSL